MWGSGGALPPIPSYVLFRVLGFFLSGKEIAAWLDKLLSAITSGGILINVSSLQNRFLKFSFVS